MIRIPLTTIRFIQWEEHQEKATEGLYVAIALGLLIIIIVALSTAEIKLFPATNK
jgi:hypothetical protein